MGAIVPSAARSQPQRGFSIVTAIFLVVVLAALGAFILTVSGTQHGAAALDIQGAQSYQAARAGIEWGAFQVLDPNNTTTTVSCAADMPACPGAGGTTDLAAGTLAGSLSSFTVTVSCTRTTATEGNLKIWVYQLVSTACNQPLGASPKCPNTGTLPSGYVERRITANLSKCKDPDSTDKPRCSCG